MLGRYCQKCGRTRQDDEFRCPCGSSTYGNVLSGDVDEATPDEAGAETYGVLGRVGVLLPYGSVLLLYGAAASGKTSIGLQTLACPWVVSGEMGTGLVTSYCKRLKVRRAGFSVPVLDPELGEVDLGIVEYGAMPREVLVDSLQSATPDGVATLRAVKRYCELHAARAIVISQVNDAGDPRGSETLLHDTDVRVRLDVTGSERRVTVEKSRHSRDGVSALFELDDAGQLGAPDWGRFYYSIEGSFPRYRIVPYPTPSTRHAELLATLDAGGGEDDVLKLPKPPLAVSALRGGRLYGRPWIEPRDAEKRRQFALRHGLAYFDVEHRKLHRGDDHVEPK